MPKIDLVYVRRIVKHVHKKFSNPYSTLFHPFPTPLSFFIIFLIFLSYSFLCSSLCTHIHICPFLCFFFQNHITVHLLLSPPNPPPSLPPVAETFGTFSWDFENSSQQPAEYLSVSCYQRSLINKYFSLLRTPFFSAINNFTDLHKSIYNLQDDERQIQSKEF